MKNTPYTLGEVRLQTLDKPGCEKLLGYEFKLYNRRLYFTLVNETVYVYTRRLLPPEERNQEVQPGHIIKRGILYTQYALSPEALMCHALFAAELESSIHPEDRGRVGRTPIIPPKSQ